MEKLISLKVPEWLMLAIDKGLKKIPFEEAAPAIQEINRQIQAQMKQKKLPDGSLNSNAANSGAGNCTQ